MTFTPTGAHPEQPRRQAEGMARLRERHRAVFGAEMPSDPPPVRAQMPPKELGYVRPLRVEHREACHGHDSRVETRGWADGLRIARCTDCLATRQVRVAT